MDEARKRKTMFPLSLFGARSVSINHSELRDVFHWNFLVQLTFAPLADLLLVTAP